MTPAELADKHVAEAKALAERHIDQWKDLNVEFEKQRLKTGDTPEFQALKLESANAFTIQMGKENRDLVATQVIENDLQSKTHDIIRNMDANSARQVCEEKLTDGIRAESQQEQRKQVKEEYNAYLKASENAERREQYNHSNIASDGAMDQTAEKRQKIEQSPPETDRELRKRLFIENMRDAQTKKRGNDNGR